MKQKNTAKYAIPCAFGVDDMMFEESLFFLTFDTQDEKLAYKLAKCVCGPQADKALIIISQEGEVYHL